MLPTARSLHHGCSVHAHVVTLATDDAEHLHVMMVLGKCLFCCLSHECSVTRHIYVMLLGPSKDGVITAALICCQER